MYLYIMQVPTASYPDSPIASSSLCTRSVLKQEHHHLIYSSLPGLVFGCFNNSSITTISYFYEAKLVELSKCIRKKFYTQNIFSFVHTKSGVNYPSLRPQQTESAKVIPTDRTLNINLTIPSILQMSFAPPLQAFTIVV